MLSTLKLEIFVISFILWHNLTFFKIETVDNTVEGLINIVTPYSIDIQIMEYNENAWETDRIQDVFERNAKSQETKFENVWNLIKDKEYYVRLSLYDETMKQIRITPNAKFNVYF